MTFGRFRGLRSLPQAMAMAGSLAMLTAMRRASSEVVEQRVFVRTVRQQHLEIGGIARKECRICVGPNVYRACSDQFGI